MHTKRLEFLIWSFLLIFVFLYTTYFLSSGNFKKGFMGIMTIGLLAAIALWQRKSPLALPAPFAVLLYMFIFAAIGMGTFMGFYRFFGYDDLLHFISGVMSGYAAWFLLLKLEGDKAAEWLSRKFIIIYILAFVMAVAGLWELLEFAGDTFLSFNAQGRDHTDTMMDMFDGLLGGTLFCILFFYVRKKRRNGI